MNEINYKANMLQLKALNLTYSTVIIVKSERKQEWAKSRTDKAELRRRSHSGDQESTEQCITIPFIHKNNQSDDILNGVWGPSSWDRPATPEFSIWEVGAGLTPSLTVPYRVNGETNSHTPVCMPYVVAEYWSNMPFTFSSGGLDDQETVSACPESILGVHTNTLLLKLLWC